MEQPIYIYIFNTDTEVKKTHETNNMNFKLQIKNSMNVCIQNNHE